MIVPNKVILTVEDLRLSFGGIRAIDGVNLKVMSDEMLGLVGPNGAGKTCLFNCISGINHPQAGHIVFQGKDIIGLPPQKVTKLGISRTFQGVELFKGMTTLGNLLLGRHMLMRENIFTAGFFFGPAQREEVRHRRYVEEIIDFMELERYRNQLVITLPLGIQKIVGLARALCMEPQLLLLDEVSAGLNRQEKEDVARFLVRIRYQLKVPIVWVEHDMQMIGDLVDRIVVMDQGHLVAEGTSQEVLKRAEVAQVYLGISVSDP